MPVHPVKTPPAQTLTAPGDTSEKVAVTSVTAAKVTVQVAFVPELTHAPPQPRNVEPGEGVAVSVSIG